jgi:hypothetical protein
VGEQERSCTNELSAGAEALRDACDEDAGQVFIGVFSVLPPSLELTDGVQLFRARATLTHRPLSLHLL